METSTNKLINYSFRSLRIVERMRFTINGGAWCIDKPIDLCLFEEIELSMPGLFYKAYTTESIYFCSHLDLLNH